MKLSITLFFVILTFTFSPFISANEHSVKDELRENLESMLNWAVNNLMPRSKKDLSKGYIDGETRDIIKKIHAHSHWLRGHMIAQINEGWPLQRIRDDYEQEEHYRDLYELTSEALERTDNQEGEKLYEMLLRFFERFVVPVGDAVGYEIRHRSGKHGTRHRHHDHSDDYDDENSRHDRY